MVSEVYNTWCPHTGKVINVYNAWCPHVGKVSNVYNAWCPHAGKDGKRGLQRMVPPHRLGKQRV